ncbi:MAG: RHS repeat-associated core domain-containing protein [Thiotrichaceae bacterium]
MYGLGLIGEESAGGYLSYHFDYGNSTVALTASDGKVVSRFGYEPYGGLVSHDASVASVTPFLFNGQYGVMTDTNGLYQMRARFYHPELRRFVNQDPVFLGGIAESQSLNRFAFVTGEPVSLVDPFGLSFVDVGKDIIDGHNMQFGYCNTLAFKSFEQFNKCNSLYGEPSYSRLFFKETARGVYDGVTGVYNYSKSRYNDPELLNRDVVGLKEMAVDVGNVSANYVQSRYQNPSLIKNDATKIKDASIEVFNSVVDSALQVDSIEEVDALTRGVVGYGGYMVAPAILTKKVSINGVPVGNYYANTKLGITGLEIGGYYHSLKELEGNFKAYIPEIQALIQTLTVSKGSGN